MGRALVISVLILLPSVCVGQEKSALLRGLEREQDLGALKPLYRTAAERGDADVARVLVNRLVAARDDDQRAALQEALGSGRYRALIPGLILEDLRAKNSTTKRWVIRGGAVVALPPRSGANPLKRQWIAVLAALPEGLAGKSGAQLFDLAWKLPALRGAVRQALADRPRQAAGILLPVATFHAADPTVMQRSELALEILKDMGPAVLPQLLQRMRKAQQGNQADDLERMWRGGGNARKAVHTAVQFLTPVDDSMPRRRDPVSGEPDPAAGAKTTEPTAEPSPAKTAAPPARTAAAKVPLAKIPPAPGKTPAPTGGCGQSCALTGPPGPSAPDGLWLALLLASLVVLRARARPGRMN